MKYKSLLVISDTHFPYSHKSTIPFLSALKKKYKPDKVVHIGDECDFHAISFHDSDPDLLSPSDELAAAIKMMKMLYKLFPKVDILESNHGSLVYRKAKAYGLPATVFKSYRSILEAPKGWHWHRDLVLDTPAGEVYITHGRTAGVGKLSQSMAMHTVQGHYHEKFSIFYWQSPAGVFWDLRVGCLADDTSLALAYNNTNLKRPIMGCASILDGEPRLLRMRLNPKGEWDGVTP